MDQRRTSGRERDKRVRANRNNINTPNPVSYPESTKEELIANWKVAVLLIGAGLLILGVFPFIKDLSWFVSNAMLNSFWFTLLMVTPIGIGVYKLSNELTSFSEKARAQIQKFLLLVIIFTYLPVWLALAVHSSDHNNDLLAEYGVNTDGHITELLEENKRNGEVDYIVKYRFYDLNFQEIYGSAIIDLTTFSNYNVYDYIGVRYLPSQPEVQTVFFSNGEGKNTAPFTSRPFNSEDIYGLNKFLHDSTGIVQYLHNVEFGFEKATSVDSVTSIFVNKHRYQRIIIKKQRYIEYTGLFDGIELVNNIKQNPLFVPITIDSSLGFAGYSRDQNVIAIQNLNESLVNFYHYRIYVRDSIADSTFTPDPYLELEGARNFVYKELHR